MNHISLNIEEITSCNHKNNEFNAIGWIYFYDSATDNELELDVKINGFLEDNKLIDVSIECFGCDITDSIPQSVLDDFSEKSIDTVSDFFYLDKTDREAVKADYLHDLQKEERHALIGE